VCSSDGKVELDELVAAGNRNNIGATATQHIVNTFTYIYNRPLGDIPFVAVSLSESLDEVPFRKRLK
jgi:hypothetical protein